VAHNNLGHALEIKGRLDEAIEHYRQATRIDPKSALCFCNLGTALGRKGRLAEAIACFRQAIQLDRNHTPAHTNLGLALSQQGKTDEAIASYQKALALEPGNVFALASVRPLLIQKGRFDEVRLAWGKALQHRPAEHDAWYGYAELCLFLGKQELYRQARKDLLERFAAITNPVVAERTARACLLLGAEGDDLKKAVALAQRAVAAVAADAKKYQAFQPYFQAVGELAEYRQGRFAQAIVLLEQAAPRVPMPALLVLAMARFRNGEKERATRTLARAIASCRWDKGSALTHDEWIRHVLRREAEELILPVPNK
jgi:serine/threonine-protein kinase